MRYSLTRIILQYVELDTDYYAVQFNVDHSAVQLIILICVIRIIRIQLDTDFYAQACHGSSALPLDTDHSAVQLNTDHSAIGTIYIWDTSAK